LSSYVDKKVHFFLISYLDERIEVEENIGFDSLASSDEKFATPSLPIPSSSSSFAEKTAINKVPIS